MKLVFRVETRKIKQPRIVVLRVLEKDGKVIHKALGSFSSKRSYEKILDQLTSEELYEFENFVKTLEFSKTNYNCDADKLDRFIIKAAPEFKNALYKIWEQAKEFNINFIPEYEMLLSLFNRAKIIEQQLAVLTNGKFNALSELGVDITNIRPPKASLKEDQKLIAAVIEKTASLEGLANMFNDIASNKYNKPPKFKPHHFEFLNKQVAQGQKQPAPKWYYTIAIDVLCNLGIKPDSIISVNLLTEHWLRLNKKGNIEETIALFNSQFQHLMNNHLCENIISASFINDEFRKMGNQFSSIPSSAIESWLEYWKKQNSSGTRELAIKSFNDEFTLLANNPFIVQLINKNFQE
jgi:hypothetical protein